MFRKSLIAATAFAFFAGATDARPQAMCGERTKLLQVLGQKYGESSTAVGLSGNGSVIEVLTSQSGTWTIIVTEPTGKSCLVASGEAWEDLPKLAMGPST